MGTGFINTGVTGIQVAQLGLATASHNITNAGTAGYNRQRIVQSSNIALLTGSGFVGQGVNVSTIERIYDGFLNSQVNTAQAKVSELDSYYSQISQIDNMLADTSSGLSPALQDFFKGVQQVAANPSQLPSRQAMISAAQALAARFQGLQNRLGQMYDSVNGQITSSVSSINSYAAQIGDLNQQIIIAQSSISQPANDLLDQRDQLVAELNKLIKVSSTTNSDGSYNVFIGTGQQLVVGTQVSKMTVTPSVADPTRLAVGLQTPGGSQELPESFVNGGSLGGLLRFRSESLDRVANDLGRNAASLALTFNAQNALGQDLYGNIAGNANFVADFFNVPTPTVVASSSNTAANPTVSVSYTSPPPFNGNFYTDLTNSDYRLTYDGTDLTLTRLTDNHTWTAFGATNVSDMNAALAIDSAGPQGFSLDPAALNPTDAGATYLIQPTRNAARDISVNAVAAADARLIAAGSPIRAQAFATNTGAATISNVSVVDGYTAPASQITLNYSDTVGELTGLFPGSPLPYVSGSTITIAGVSFVISGAPKDGDTFSIERNTGAVTDGRNALALSQLQTQKTMSGKTASYQSAYAQLVSDNGNKTRELKVTGAAQQALLDQSSSARDSLSGVNLDEEAANLIKYQQAYQASAKVLDIGSKLFDVLLSIGA